MVKIRRGKEGQKEKIKDLEERLLRLQAEFENFRKRKEKERESICENASASLLSKLLPVLDQFELAIKHVKDDGIKMIYNNLVSVLKSEGLREMNSQGKSFDPYYHEAIKKEKGEDGKVLKVIQKGYFFKDRVLRHAKVVVGVSDNDG